MTTCPVVPAISRPRSSTIAPRAPSRLTVRNAWCALPSRTACRAAPGSTRRAAEGATSPAATMTASPPPGRRSPGCGSTARRRASTAGAVARPGGCGAASTDGEVHVSRSPRLPSRVVGWRRTATRPRARRRGARARTSATRAPDRRGATPRAAITAGRSSAGSSSSAAASCARRSGVSSSSASRSAAIESSPRSRCGSPPAARTNIARRRAAFSSASSIATSSLDEPAQNHEQLAPARVEPRTLELLEPSPGPGSHPSRLRSSRS